MSIEISIDGVDATQAYLTSIGDLIQNSADGLMEAVQSTALPDVIEASQTVWGVETGEYSSSWDVETISSNAVSLFNNTEYASALEYGWTRGETTVTSPGVLFPTVENDVDAIAGALGNWLQNQLSTS